MRVPSSAFSDSLVTQLQKLSQRQAQLQNQVATGQRITNISDDPAAVARVMNGQTSIQQIQQFARNNAHATEISQTTYSSVNELKKISDRAGELGLLGGGVASPDSNQAYAAETDQLLEQTVQIANTKHGGIYIFGGVKTDQPPFSVQRDAAGKITSVAYAGSSSSAAFQVGEGTTISPYTSGSTNAQFAEFANNLAALRDGLQNNDSSAISVAQGKLQASEDRFLTTISDIGAVQTRLESAETENQARFTGLQNLASQDTDVDLAPTMVKLTQTQTAYSAAIQAGAKIMQSSLLDYLK
jgi:flagellar hook-associated protein 3 FlgL